MGNFVIIKTAIAVRSDVQKQIVGSVSVGTDFNSIFVIGNPTKRFDDEKIKAILINALIKYKYLNTNPKSGKDFIFKRSQKDITIKESYKKDGQIIYVNKIVMQHKCAIQLLK